MRKLILQLPALLLLVCALQATQARADSLVIDPVNDFRAAYAGPRNGDLDVVTTQVTFTGTQFLFAGTMNAPIGTTPGAFYVFGINRGEGTARFGAIAPNVLFDSVVVIRPGGASTVTDQILGTTTPLSNANIMIFGNSFLAQVPASLLPSRGFSFAQYTFNLWPRFQVGSAGNSNTDIADFAPDNGNALVTVAPTAVPEPSTMILLGTGLAAAGAARRRRKAGRKEA